MPLDEDDAAFAAVAGGRMARDVELYRFHASEAVRRSLPRPQWVDAFIATKNTIRGREGAWLSPLDLLSGLQS